MTIPDFKQELAVRDYETDLTSRLKPSNFYRLIQYTASCHADMAGYNFYEMMATGQAWVLFRSHIHIHRYPTIDDRLIVHTWINGFQQKLLYVRAFSIEDLDGGLVASAHTASLLINTATRQIIKPSTIPDHQKFDIPNPTPYQPLDKIDAPEDMPECYQIKAAYSHIDNLGHVNNNWYIDWVCDCFDADYYRRHELAELQINFLQEIRPGEQISMHAAPEGTTADTWLFSGENLTRGLRSFDARGTWRVRQSGSG